ncbi:Oxidoreductase R1 [Cladobotryum mycophilum]|uniref:Oxidoreductase R1 n=1 Tax=Cladobotryum mycophilum TaxID=491253 RepID=A0ABR0SZY3_9HYPO
MLSTTTRPSLAIYSRLGYASVARRRNQATLASELSHIYTPDLPIWNKSKPFEHAPWRTPSKTKGTIRFLGPTKDGKPAFLNFEKGREHETNFGTSLEKVVDITDLRTFEPKTTVGVEGIEWVHAPSVLSEDKLLQADSKDVEAFVRGPYFEECEKLVKERTGAIRAIPYNFRHRRIEHNTNIHDPYKFSNKPLPNFHMDNDAETAKVNLRRVLGDEEATRWLGKRWGIINIWRPVGDVVRQWPLALVDSRTVSYNRDTAPIFTLHNYKTHFVALRPQSHFNFYYVSNLAPDEALLFVDYDSAHEGSDNVVGMAHGAFEDHNAPQKVPKRRSIEVRCLVLYED